MLPFTREQFLGVFAAYNSAIWPAEIVAYLIAAAMLWLVFQHPGSANRLVAAGVALMWLWTGVAYHWMFFSPINTAALGFGALFVVESGLLAYFGVVRRELNFGMPRDAFGWLGVAFILYSAVLYPLIGMFSGHPYPEMPMFGVTPCPVTLFTIGLLLLTNSRVPAWLLVVPFLWSLVGGSAAVVLTVPQDWLLLASGLAVVPLIVLRDHRRRRIRQPG